MSIRDNYFALGIRVSDLTDAKLEAVALDILAEYGELLPTVAQITEIVERQRNKVEREVPAYIPAIALHDLLDFEAGDHGANKERRIRECFGVTPARYVLLLNRALDDPAAMAYAPMLVARLLRIRERRRELRWAVSA